jgi:putative hemolysin
MWIEISIIAALLLLNAFFAMSELAVVSASKPLLRQAAQLAAVAVLSQSLTC